MASDYEKIKADNIRDYGEKTHHLAFLGRLYTDRTHFVFELLQNAEDKSASRVLFRLYDDRLEVRHDGVLFDEPDVRGNCGVGEGTKADDLTKIGKFGIGFKAVYAYTSIPEVHSGDEHFRIEHYVRPSAAIARSPGNGWTTLFVFSFDPAKVLPENASREIAGRLRGLTARTLLFLRKIKEIEYVLPESARGIYLREEAGQARGRLITVIGDSAGSEESERWLLFEKPVPVPGDSQAVTVEIGFKLETGEKERGEGIARVRESPLYVFFPTEKQTQFGFLIQGPYRTTPARDNIPKDDDWNATLIDATATLIVEALHDIREHGLLTVTALNALPIRLDAFPADGMFSPIVEAVRDALRTGQLLPADDGSYVTAANAKLARGVELRRLLGRGQLATLYPTGDETKWLAGEITQDRTPDLRSYLLSKLGIEEVDPDGFARKLSRTFLSVQPDQWFVLFYRYLSDQEALWRAPRFRGDTPGVLRSKPILRLQDDRLEAPFRSDGQPNVYLPPPEGTDLPSVKRQIAEDEQAADYLRRLGLSEPDLFDDIVKRVLPKYSSDRKISDDEHDADIQKLFRALTLDSEAGKNKVITSARQTPFLRASNGAGQPAYKRPGDVYRDDPDLRLYFDGASDAWFTNERFPDEPPADDIWDSLGVARRPRRILFSRELPEGVRRRSTRGEKIENYRLDGFENFVGLLARTDSCAECKRRALILWRYMAHEVREDREFFSGRYHWFYYSDESRRFDSSLLTKLRQSAWLPISDETLKAPTSLKITDLLPEFRNDDELIILLQVNTDDQTEEAKKRVHATELGVPLENIEFIRLHADEFERWKATVSAPRPAFPVKPSTDATRRRERIAEQWDESEEKKYEERSRSVRTSRSSIDPQVWLRDTYTNDDGKMVCQLCGDEMPFKKRNGEYYFEAVEALDREELSREHPEQFLALCPVCAAKYKEFVKSEPDVVARVKEALVNTEGMEIPVTLGSSEERLRFVEIHLNDLRTILSKEK